MSDENVGGSFWSVLFGSRQGGTGRRQILAGPPPAAHEEGETRPKYRGPMMRVKCLVSEAGRWGLEFQAGDVIDMPAELARPRLLKGQVRLARPDERLTAEDQ
jgi:hypothetical protein